MKRGAGETLVDSYRKSVEMLLDSEFSSTNLLASSNARAEFIKWHSLNRPNVVSDLERKFAEIDKKFEDFVKRLGRSSFICILNNESIVSGDAAEKALHYYKRRLLDLRESLEDNKGFNFLTISAVLENREAFYLICKKMKEVGLDTRLLEEKIVPLNKLFNELIAKMGKKNYFDEVELRLQQKIDSYAYSIKHKMYEEPHEFEFDLNARDSIEAMLREIRDKRDINILKTKLYQSDKKFKKAVAKLSKKFNIINEPHYPKSFWWRHLKD